MDKFDRRASKNHSGTSFTCILKNMMGASSSMTNLYMHFAGKKGLSWYADINHLSQCIADLNLIRKPDWCISDSTQFLTTNGPYGPGQIKRLDTIVAGTDCVLVDAYCSTLLNLKPENIAMIKMAAAQNLGKMNLQNAKIQETHI